MNWNLIETAPKNGVAILIWDGICVTTAQWTGEWTLCAHGDYAEDCRVEPTHWAELPMPPGQEIAQEEILEDQIAELKAAGWSSTSPSVWKSPAGALYRGPHGAWKAMKAWRKGHSL